MGKSLNYYCLLTILCLLLYLPGIMTIPITDRDSAHFAQASRQMYLSHDDWSINFQNTPRHLKPPGIYWLHTLSIKTLGGYSHQVWPYTLISVLGATLAVLLTFAFTARIYSKQKAFLASSLLAASPLLIFEAHLVITDTVFLATIVLMQGALWQLYRNHRHHNMSLSHWVWPLLFWLGMSAGILIKGISPLFAGLTIITLCIIDKNIRWLKQIRFHWGIPLLLLCTASWLIPLSVHTHSNFLWDMVSHDVLPKLAGGQESHGMIPGYFTLLLTPLFWPGALFLGFTCCYAYYSRHQIDVCFLLAWLIPIWIFIELTPTKLPEYALPVFPAFSILTALALFEIHEKSFNINPFFCWLIRFQYAFWVVAGLLLTTLFILAPIYFEGQIFTSSIIAASIILFTMLLSMIMINKHRFIETGFYNVVGITLSSFIVFQTIIPNLHELWVSQKIVAALHRVPFKVTQHNPLLVIGYHEPSLIFMGKNNVVWASPWNITTKLQQYHPRIILVDQRSAAIIQKTGKHLHLKLKSIADIHGFNYSKGRWVTLTLYIIKNNNFVEAK